TQGKQSDVSNMASISPVEGPGRVTGLIAVPDQRRIFVKWDKPKEGSALAEAYVVLRTDIPADADTVPETHYEAIRYRRDKNATDVVTAVSRVDGTVVTGVGPESVPVVADDKPPPMVPSGIQIQLYDMGDFVTCPPNDEPDLADYRVFRSEHAQAGLKPIT